MKPLIYSQKNVDATGNGWYRGGSNIIYYPSNKQVKRIGTADTQMYTLSFKFKLDFDDDTVYFSHCYPYTFSDLI
jgi:hypothetical protein